MRPIVIRLLAVAAVVLSATATASAHARAPRRDAAAAIDDRVRAARPAQLLGGGFGAVLGAGAGLSLGFVLGPGCTPVGEGACPRVARDVVVPASVLLLIPTVTAGAVAWIGEHRELDGSYSAAWVGSALGTALGVSVGALLPLAVDRPEAARWLAPTLTLTGASAGATLGHGLSARSRLADSLERFSPSLSLTDDREGLVLQLSGRF